MSSGPSLGWPRGGLVGAVVGLLGVAAHGAAGGGYPDTAELALLLMVSAAVGAAAVPRAQSAAAPVPVPVLLALGQFAAHVVLSGLSGHPAHGTAPTAVPSGWMITAHVVATVACAVLLASAERLYRAASGTIRALFGAPRPPAPVAVLPVPAVGRRHYRSVPKGVAAPRAPPVWSS